MDVLFLAFANDREAPLQTLQQEDNEIYKYLSPLVLQQRFIVHRDSYATIENISHFLTQYRNHVRLFMYSGHAGKDRLLLEDQEASAGGIAHLLGQCPLLQLVFLNGCSTKGQVEAILNIGIPAVIATSAPIDDKKAAEFSIRFYQALTDQATIKEAFELAKGEILTRYPDVNISIQGGTVDLSSLKKEETLWGLYSTKEEVLSWKLPTNTRVAQITDFKPNEKLLAAIVKGLSKYDKNFADILEEEAMGSDVSLGKKINMIIPSFPHIVSGQLAKLLIPPSPGSDDMQFYHTPSKDRLQQITIVYNTLMQLFGYTMMAQMWDSAGKVEDFKISAENMAVIKDFMTLESSVETTHDFTILISEIRSILDKNEKPYFISELKDLAVTFNESQDLADTLQYMENLKQLAFLPTLSEEEAREHCVLAEVKLAMVMEHVGFLTKYTLASVKSIDVLKFRHFTEPKYRHNMVKLIQTGATDPFSESEKPSTHLLDSNSVLIYKETDEGRAFLNLSPFLMDQNAFDKKAVMTKLYFFFRYQPKTQIFQFSHVYKPKDPLININDEKHFPLLKAQFEAFSQSIFKQPLEAI